VVKTNVRYASSPPDLSRAASRSPSAPLVEAGMGVIGIKILVNNFEMRLAEKGSQPRPPLFGLTQTQTQTSESAKLEPTSDNPCPTRQVTIVVG
jgi:hypothetical protein